MSRVLRILLILVAVLVVLAFGASRYLLGRTPVPEKSTFVLDLGEVRRLASSVPGDLPLRVNYEQVAEASLPKGAVFAGESLTTPHPMTHGAYQVAYPDSSVVIDSGFDADALKQMNPGSPFLEEGYAAIQRAMEKARAVVITHEHPDHIGGIAHAEHPDMLLGRVMLTKEQLANDDQLTSAGFPADFRSKLKPLDYEKYYALAPGVVLIKAPGHTPGTQIVYVKLANGKELLFLGDVAWHMDQIRELWYRPRLVTDFFLHENRDQVLAQFRTLHDLAESEPVQLVVSHDIDQRKQLIDSGVLGPHFENRVVRVQGSNASVSK